ncbi:MAG: pentapeptide repeat-containing protein [SAR324 cluster bacterium]|nr:pentapeptide repeat-containing protein [SAR324 cluster bacterium]
MAAHKDIADPHATGSRTFRPGGGGGGPLGLIRIWVLRVALLAGAVLISCAQGVLAQQGEAGRDVRKIVADHILWLAELGDPKFLDAAGIDSGLIPQEKMEDPRRADLSGRDLVNLRYPGVVLRAAELSGVKLSGAQLAGANFSHAIMGGALLSSANLQDAQMRQVLLSKADLRDANLAGADLRGANLSGADLRGANLAGAGMAVAILSGADLRDATLNGADLQGADLTQAVLANAGLELADLRGAQLIDANLDGAGLKLTNLEGAQLFGAVLDNAFLYDTNLSGADLTGASLRGINLFANKLHGTRLEDVDMTGVVFEPNEAYLAALAKNLDSLARSKNLGLMTFYLDARPLRELRRALTREGYKRQVLDITYALRRGLRQKVSNEGSLPERLVSLMQYFFLELPIEYGASPYRPIGIICMLVVVFGFVYMVPLLRPSERFGQIWKVTPQGRFFSSNDRIREEVLRAGNLRGLLMAFWFSFLAAFNIGGKIFNMDDLFIHCQREEYHLRGTRWVRSIAGVQALISIYLLVLTLLVFLEKVAF